MTAPEVCTPPDLSNLKLLNGSHENRDRGVCLMEAVAWVAGEPHSDRPACTCPALGVFARRLNDAYWPGGDPQRTEILRPLIPLLVGTVSTHEVYRRRGHFFADRAVRELTPMALDSWADRRERWGRHEAAALLREVALKLRAVPEIVDEASARAAYGIARGLREGLRAKASELWKQYYAAAAADADAAAAAAAAADADADAAAARLPVLRRAAEILAEAARITAAPGAAGASSCDSEDGS